jgi:hypothetical protein
MSSVANASLNHPCPTCMKRFPNRAALKAHTGTKSLGSATAHRCNLCDQRFCSATALQQHQEAPAHDTMFKCNECEKSFRGKEALKSHQKAKQHGKSKSLVGPVLITNRGPFAVQRSRSQRWSAEDGWKLNSNTGQMMDMHLDQNWGLCDKDCGWCGHCADNVDF